MARGSATFGLIGGGAAALVMLPFAVSAKWSDALFNEGAAFAAGLIGAGLVWRLARPTTARGGAGIGAAATLVVHLLLAIMLSLPAGIDAATPMLVGLIFAWGLVLVGWVSLPLGALTGWWLARRTT